MANLKLSVQTGGLYNETPSSIDIPMRILTTGNFTDMNGTEVEVTEEMLNNIANRYNLDAEKTYQIDSSAGIITPSNLNDFVNRNCSIQEDHEAGKVGNTTGRIKGRFRVKSLVDGGYGIFVTGHVQGKDNVDRVLDGRLKNLSIQFDLESFETIEVSWVTRGADPRAFALLGKGEFVKLGSFEQVCLQLIDNIDRIRSKQSRILALERGINVNSRLVILCKRNKITKSESRELANVLQQSTNAVEILNTLDDILPIRMHKGTFIPHDKNKEIYQKIRFQGDNMNTVLKGDSPKEIVNNLLLTTANPSDGSASFAANDDDDKKELSKKKRQLTEKMGDCYDKGDAEMGKKYREKLKKLMDDEDKGKLSALSDYDVDEEGGKGKENGELKAELQKTKDEVNILLEKTKSLENTIVSLQSVQNTKTAEDILKTIKTALESGGVK